MSLHIRIFLVEVKSAQKAQEIIHYILVRSLQLKIIVISKNMDSLFFYNVFLSYNSG